MAMISIKLPAILALAGMASLALPMISEGAEDRFWVAAFGSGVFELPEGTHNQGSKATARRPRIQPATAAPTPPSPPPQAASNPVPPKALGAQGDAETLVATYQAATEAGIAFPANLPKEVVVSALSNGIAGGGAFAETSFRVPGLTADRQAAVLDLIEFKGGKLVLASATVPQTMAMSQKAASAPTAAKADSRTVFAEGWLKVAVPSQFIAEPGASGELILRTEGATLTLKLEQYGDSFDSWLAVRKAADGAGLGANMAGRNVYVTLPDRRQPKRALVGVDKALVSIAIDAGEPGSAGSNMVRFALPTIVETLALAR